MSDKKFALIPANLSEGRGIAQMLAKSNLFGAKTEAEVFSLMLLADAEGLHPAAAARDYHIIQGRPTLRADAMLARFQAAGGKVKWLERNDKCVKAVFSHDAGGEVEVEWTWERANSIETWNRKQGRKVKLTESDNWQNYPRNMLSARCISEGVRTVFPGVVAGVYAPEEVEDAGDVDLTQAPTAPPRTTQDDEVVVQAQVEEYKKHPGPPPNFQDHTIKRIQEYADQKSLDAYIGRQARAIAEQPKPVRDAIQKAIRAKRDELAAAPPAGDPGVVEAEQAAEVLDAEIVEISDEPVETPPEIPQDIQEETPGEPESALQRFCVGMGNQIRMAPTSVALEGLWNGKKVKLDRVKKNAAHEYEALETLYSDRMETLVAFEGMEDDDA